MKNFRKVLALILVVATLFSFVAMASAKTADEYSDYADVKYVEAVDVLTAIGINEGYDGAFHPADPIDRDEVAAMIARLRYGTSFDADLYVGADNVFADVKGQWSEGYVTYCAQLGIIAGRNASTFDPDGKVTGTEVLKMLLCVLGYDAAEQGYTGANWQVNVVRDATKAGLLIDGVDVYAAATRDEVAQYFLNALKAKMVIGYIGEGLINITNSIWMNVEEKEGKYTLKGVEHVTPDAVGDGVEVTYCNAVISNDYLWESVKGLDLVSKEVEDCYKRPGHKWTLKVGSKVTTIGVYTDAPKATFTDATVATVAAKLQEILNAAESYYYEKGAYADDYREIPVYIDGADDTTINSNNKSQYWKKDNANWAGNGVLVEVYADRVVVINTYIAKVDNVYAYGNTFDLVNEEGTTLATFKLGDYEIEDGDMVLYWICNGACQGTTKNQNTVNGGLKNKILHDLKVVEPVNVDVTAGDNYINDDYRNDSILYTAGANYQYAWNLGKWYAYNNNMWASSVEDGANYDLYLDEYGYIMHYEVPEAEDNLKFAYLVEGTATMGNYAQVVGKDTWTYTADLVNFGDNGVVTEDVVTDDDLYRVATLRYKYDETLNPDEDDHIGTLLSYYYDEDGKFQLGGEARYAKQGAKLSKDSWEIDDGVIVTSKTKFMIRTVDSEGEYVYTEITGRTNLPGTYYAETVLYRERVGQRLERRTGTNIQYFIDPETPGNGDKPDYAEYVFIDAKFQDAEADHFIVLDKAEYLRFETVLDPVYGENYAVYDAIVDGERALIASDKPLKAGAMYHEILSFVNFKATLADGTQLELYWYASEDTSSEATYINYTYTVDEGEVYMGYTDSDGWHTTMLADGCKFFVLTAAYDAATNSYSLDAMQQIVNVKTGDQDGAYILIDEDTGMATEVYLITDLYTKEVLGIGD